MIAQGIAGIITPEVEIMIDIHCHMLPGVDDGSDTLDNSLLMASMAAESGTDIIVVTPHCNIPGEPGNYPTRELLEKFIALREAIDAAQIPLKILAGAEVFCTPDIAELIRQKKLLPLASSRYLLVEFAFNEDSIEMNSRLEQIFAEGLIPVIAHPERYNAVQRDRTLPERWFAAGYIMQINKDSVFGNLGQRAKRTAEFMLSQGLAHVAASDAHGTYSRTTELEQLREHISLNYSEEYAHILLEENPRRIIENKPILRA